MHEQRRHPGRRRPGRRAAVALVAVVALAAALSSISAVTAAPPPPVNAVTAPCVDIGVDYATGDEAVERLGDDIDVAADIVDVEPAELREELLEDDTLAVDRCGRSFYIEPATTESPEAIPDVAGVAPTATDLPLPTGVSTDDAFRLHSKPGAVRTIHLDFDGGYVTADSAWTDGFTDGRSFTASPYSLDGDPTTFSIAERNAIIQIWAQVAEDYAPFDVDITTEDPGFNGADRTASADTRYGSWTVISNDFGPGGTDCECGGIAYVDVFDLVGGHIYRPAFVFAPQVSFDTKNIAEAVSHEVGHNLGLRHDGTSSPVAEYYTGRGAWAPIMGIGYSRPVVQWSNGDYTGASRTEDDVAIIAASGAPAVTDDHGGTTATATDLGAALPAAADGVIGARGDVDVFKVTVPGGTTTFRVQPTGTSPNLDTKLFVYDAGGVELGSNDPAVAFVNKSTATGLDASLTLTLAAGDHYLAVDGVGWGSASTGYSDYGSLGAYGVAVTTNGGPAVTTASLPATVAGQPYRSQLGAVGGSGTLTWAVTAGALPDGLALSSTGLLRGTPTTTDPATFTVTVTDGAARSAQRNFTVEPTVAITSADPPDARRSNAYSTTLSAVGGTAPYTWSLASGALPTGLTLSSAGVISGTASTNTTAAFVLRVTDSVGRTTTRPTTLTVVTSLAVGAIAAQNLRVGDVVSVQATSTGGRASKYWSVASGTLPPGVTFDDTGLLSGAATTAGDYSAALQVTDLAGNTATRAVSFTVTVGTPAAVADSWSTPAGSTLNVAAPGVLGNDTDPDDDPLTAQLVSTTANGTLALNANGSFTYSPTVGFRGTDSFTYRAVDSADNVSEPATVTITVTNRAPVAVADTYEVDVDTVLQVDGPGVLANDTDPDGDAMTVVSIRQPDHGMVLFDDDGGFEYVPNVAFSGTDSFTYSARDAFGAQSEPTTVTVTVRNEAPTAVADSYSTPAGTPLVVAAPGVLGNDSDADGDGFSAEPVSLPANGTLQLDADGSFTYTPAEGFRGTDTFTYRARDSFGAPSSPATVTITVTNRAPTAVDDVYAVVAGSTLNVAAPGVLGNDSDPDGGGITAQLVTSTANGTLSLQANGSFTYTPTSGFRGTDSFTYSAADADDDASAPATVTITVQNRAPSGAPDSWSTPAATQLVVAAPGVLVNDSDPDSDTLGAEVVDAPAHGSLALATDGSFTYTPDAGFRGDDGFTYRVRDALGAVSSPVVVELTVTNRAPTAVADSFSTDAATTLIVSAPGLLANDTDPDGDVLNSTVVTQPSYGTLLLFADGALLYTPVTGFRGTDSFTYRAVDALGGLSAPVTVTVDVVNRAPVAVDDDYETEPGAPLAVTAPGVLANDTDLDDDPLDAELVTTTAQGTLVFAADGSFTYTPAPGFRGDDGFTYRVRDSEGAASDVATVTVTVVNAVPVAVADAYSTPAGTPLVVDAPGLLDNDTDGDGDTLVVDVVTQPTNGTLNAATDGSFTYTPAAGYRGTDGFTYRARDPFGATSAETTVTITVTNRPPVAVADAYATDAGTALQIDEPGVLANDSDADGDAFVADLVTQPADGSVVADADGGFVYVPDTGFRGTDSFTYRVRDALGAQSAPTTVTVIVRNRAPTAAADGYSTPAGTQLVVAAPGLLANDADPDSDTLSAEVVSPPANGTLSLATDGAFTYTPADGYRGSDTFTYRARDAFGAVSAATTVGVNVTNRAPTASGDSYSTPAGTPLVVDAPGLVGNDTDPDGDTLDAEVVTQPANGTVVANGGGAFTYTPADGFRGTDSFTYRARDAFGAPSSPATVTVAVTNRPPVTADDVYSVNGDTVLDVTAPGVLANDTEPDGDAFTLTLVTGPTDGTLDLAADGAFTYTPRAGFAGTDTFTYRLTDEFSASVTATVTITVRSPDPVAVADTYTTPAGTALVVAAPGALGNDTGPDGVALTAQIVTAPTSGSVTLAADGSFTYTPAVGFRGTATFTYRALGAGAAQSTPATVTVTVTNRAPTATANGYSVAADTTLQVAAPGLLGNDSDPDGDPLVVEIVTPPTSAVVTVGTAGTFTFVPQNGFWGVEQFTYRVRDPGGAVSAPAIVTVSVTPAPRRWFFEDLDGRGLTGDGRAASSTVGADPSSVIFDGAPHAFYRDDTTGRLRHAWWTGQRWQFEDLDGPDVPGGFGRTDRPIAHGTSTTLFGGLPHVFYGDADGRLRHAWWTGQRWWFENLDGPGVPGGDGRLAAPLEGRIDASLYGTLPHVYYRDAANGDLRHAWWGGQRWFFETLDGDGGTDGRSSASVGGDVDVVYFDGAPHAFYRDDTNGRLRHGWWTGQRWAFEELDGPGVGGGFGRTDARTGGSVTALLFGGAPHVWYANDDGSALRHGWWTGVRWQFEVNDTAAACGAGCDVGAGAVATLQGGLPTVVHSAGGRGGVRRSFWNGAAWQSAFFDGPDAPQVDGRVPATVDGSVDAFVYGGQPHVLYRSPATGRLRHAWFS